VGAEGGEAVRGVVWGECGGEGGGGWEGGGGKCVSGVEGEVEGVGGEE